MPSSQERYDDAMFDFSTGNYDTAIAKLETVLADDPGHFESLLALGMAHCRKGDFATAIALGHRAEQMRPQDPLVHTNLSLFYLKAGNQQTAELHGLRARIASWKADTSAPRPGLGAPDELQLARPKPPAPEKFPEMPWKKKPGAAP